LTIFCAWPGVMSWQATAPMTGAANRWHRRRWVSACLRGPPVCHRETVRVEVPRDQVRAGPGHVRRAHGKTPPDLLQLGGELLLRDGLALLPFAVLVPDRPPATALVTGRVHGDLEVEFDDRPVTTGGGPGLDAGNQAGRQPGCPRHCRALAGTANRATGRLWGFCGDLEDRGCCLRHLHFLASCVSAGRRADANDLGRWSGAGSNRRPSAFQVNRA
jgi:hypothetical protein